MTRTRTIDDLQESCFDILGTDLCLSERESDRAKELVATFLDYHAEVALKMDAHEVIDRVLA